MPYSPINRIQYGGSSSTSPAFYMSLEVPAARFNLSMDKISLESLKVLNMAAASNRKDLTNKVFGRLTVISYSHTYKKRAFWNCICLCGNPTVSSGKLLIKGSIQSCGCLKAELEKAENLVGRIFGELTVIAHSHQTKEKTRNKEFWLCRCSCGYELVVEGSSLRSGKSSCGCKNQEENISGNVYGRLTALYRWTEDRRTWLFLCDCGNTCVAHKSNVVSGITSSCGCYRREVCVSQIDKVNASGMMKGSGNHKWKGGITPLKKSIRESAAYYLWRNTILKRDEHHCQDCSITVGDLHVHHIEHLSKIIQKFNIKTIEEALACPLIWDIDNGITLCENCHQDRHPDIQIIALKRTA